MTVNIQKFNYDIDLTQALLWQYNSAERLQSLLAAKQAWYGQEHSAFWEAWVRDVFDLTTADDFGLTVWATILGVPLVANAAPTDARPVFGFGADNLNFFESNFGRDTGTVISLTTEQKRLILRLRVFQLISDGCVPSINEMLGLIFGDQGRVYVLDGEDMTCEYVFQFFPSSRVLFVLENYDILPRPAGVQLRVLINPGDSFGFDPYYLNFENSNFSG